MSNPKQIIVPDYLSPVVGYRAWEWNSMGLFSICNIPWEPGEANKAHCIMTRNGPGWISPSATFDHHSPSEECTCGLYAAKNLQHLDSLGYLKHRVIHGEVNLWGKIIEHRAGYRAEYAYPKNFVIPFRMIPVSDAERRFSSLTAFGVDIFIEFPKMVKEDRVSFQGNIPFWNKTDGFSEQGTRVVISRLQQITKQKTVQPIKVGDRIAICGWTHIGVIEEIVGDDIYIRFNSSQLLIAKRDYVTWCFQNNRWETDGINVVGRKRP